MLRRGSRTHSLISSQACEKSPFDFSSKTLDSREFVMARKAEDLTAVQDSLPFP